MIVYRWWDTKKIEVYNKNFLDRITLSTSEAKSDIKYRTLAKIVINFVLGSNLMIGSSIFYRKFLKLDLMVVMEFDQCPRAWPQRSKTIVSYFFVNVFSADCRLISQVRAKKLANFSMNYKMLIEFWPAKCLCLVIPFRKILLRV